jgi:acetylornithine/succinyldiaminopimelate/putrescine aminotransferase
MPTIVAGDGIHLLDDRGRRLLDVVSGPFLANLGQGNERVLQAMLEQGRRLTYTYSRTTRHAANAQLTEQLATLAGPAFERVHLTSGGSEAVEMALKFLRQYAVAIGQPERHRVISMLPGYHGATTQTLGSGRERGWSGDLRRSPKAPLNVPSVDPDDQLESVGASPLAPTTVVGEHGSSATRVGVQPAPMAPSGRAALFAPAGIVVPRVARHVHRMASKQTAPVELS